MSDIVEKTLTALPGLFLQSPGGGGPAAAQAAFSSRLGGLIRGITALTSKHVSAAGPGSGRRGGPRAGSPARLRGVRRARAAGPGTFASVWKPLFPGRLTPAPPQLALALTH